MPANTFPCKTRYGRAPIEDLELANKAYVDTGSVPLITQAEVEGGTDTNARSISGLRVKQGIDALSKSMIVDSVESSNTTVTDDQQSTLTDRKAYSIAFNLPTTFEFFIITGIEWKNGTTVNGQVIAGVDILDAFPPVSRMANIVALNEVVNASGTSSVQRPSILFSNLIPKSSLLSAWIQTSSATQQLRSLSGGSSQNIFKSETHAVALQVPVGDGIAWSTSNLELYMKVYFKGVGLPN